MSGHNVFRIVFALALGAQACAGEPRVLPPRTPPPRKMPYVNVPRERPQEGYGRVVLDAIDGPMQVTVEHDPSFKLSSEARLPSRTGELCTTPCVVDLPVGRYRLYLFDTTGEQRGDQDDLRVQSGLNVYRRAVGKYVTPSAGDRIAPTIVLVIAAGLAVAGVAFAVEEEEIAAIGFLGSGVALGIGGGIWAYQASRAIEQQGATTYYLESLP